MRVIGVARADALTRPYSERWGGHAVAVDGDVPVRNELARLLARRSQSKPINHVVQTGLQQLQQARTRDALRLSRAIEVVPELCLLDAVDASQFLLLAQAHTELAQLPA